MKNLTKNQSGNGSYFVEIETLAEMQIKVTSTTMRTERTEEKKRNVNLTFRLMGKWKH